MWQDQPSQANRAREHTHTKKTEIQLLTKQRSNISLEQQGWHLHINLTAMADQETSKSSLGKWAPGRNWSAFIDPVLLPTGLYSLHL
jgi:hypothetical protein